MVLNDWRETSESQPQFAALAHIPLLIMEIMPLLQFFQKSRVRREKNPRAGSKLKLSFKNFVLRANEARPVTGALEILTS